MGKIKRGIEYLQTQVENGHTEHRMDVYVNQERFRSLRIPIDVLIESLEDKQERLLRDIDKFDKTYGFVKNLQPDDQGKSVLDD